MGYPQLFVDKVIKSVTRKKAKQRMKFRFIRNNVIPAPRRGNPLCRRDCRIKSGNDKSDFLDRPMTNSREIYNKCETRHSGL